MRDAEQFFHPKTLSQAFWTISFSSFFSLPVASGHVEAFFFLPISWQMAKQLSNLIKQIKFHAQDSDRKLYVGCRVGWYDSCFSQEHLSSSSLINIFMFGIGNIHCMFPFLDLIRNFNIVKLWKSSDAAGIAARWRASTATGGADSAAETYPKRMAEGESTAKLLLKVLFAFCC